MGAQATHVGECQLCGRTQKLPDDRLAKHGYSIRWGCFIGVCTGSGHLPFEQSKDLLEDAIANALKDADDLDIQSEPLNQPATSAITNCLVYRDHNQCFGREKPGYIWVFGEIVIREPKHGNKFRVLATKDERVMEYSLNTGMYAENVLEAATENNRQWARVLTVRAKQLRSYAAWQRRRADNWEPKPITSPKPVITKHILRP